MRLNWFTIMKNVKHAPATLHVHSSATLTAWNRELTTGFPQHYSTLTVSKGGLLINDF